jgi:hypothetical protein
MLTGKAYARAIRGHFLTSSALLSMLLEEFWESLSIEERSHLNVLYDSKDPSSRADDDLAVRLVSWYEQKKTVLTSSSRTATLWLSYIRYFHVVQAFIKAERTSDWLLHIIATKSMLNLFAATGHNNYAKSCRRYLQSMEEMQQKYPFTFEQFLTWKSYC